MKDKENKQKLVDALTLDINKGKLIEIIKEADKQQGYDITYDTAFPINLQPWLMQNTSDYNSYYWAYEYDNIRKTEGLVNLAQRAMERLNKLI